VEPGGHEGRPYAPVREAPERVTAEIIEFMAG
jgi:hypothetical protein